MVDVGPLTLGGVLAAARHDAEKIDVACLESEICEALVDAPLAQRAHERRGGRRRGRGRARRAAGTLSMPIICAKHDLANSRARLVVHDDTVSVATSATSTTRAQF